jgi:hypothetical protein
MIIKEELDFETIADLIPLSKAEEYIESLASSNDEKYKTLNRLFMLQRCVKSDQIRRFIHEGSLKGVYIENKVSRKLRNGSIYTTKKWLNEFIETQYGDMIKK